MNGRKHNVDAKSLNFIDPLQVYYVRLLFFWADVCAQLLPSPTSQSFLECNRCIVIAMRDYIFINRLDRLDSSGTVKVPLRFTEEFHRCRAAANPVEFNTLFSTCNNRWIAVAKWSPARCRCRKRDRTPLERRGQFQNRNDQFKLIFLRWVQAPRAHWYFPSIARCRSSGVRRDI